MKFLRIVSLIALAVALSAGFFAGDAEAAVLDSIRVVRPDSGVVRGIDSLIVAEAYLRTTSADSSVAVFFWLATAADSKVELVDTDDNGVIGDSLGFAQGDTTAAGASNTLIQKAVVARATLKKGEVASPSNAGWLQANGQVNKARIGDADSVWVKPGPSVSAGVSWVVECFIKVSPDVKEVDGIAVFASVYDKNAVSAANALNGFTPVKAAQRGWATKIDGDRPSQASLLLKSIEPRGGKWVTGFTTGRASKQVLGIGDTVKIEYDLGTQGDAIILAGNLTLSAQLAYDKSVNINLGTIKHKVDSAFVIIGEDQLGDISTASATGNVGLFLADPAGNLSSLNVGDINDDATPTGLTKTADFVVDATRPKLDAQVGALTDTILPVDNDTITDGGVRDAYRDDKNPMAYNLGEALSALKIVFDNSDDANDRTFTIPATSAGSTAGQISLLDAALLKDQNRTIDWSAVDKRFSLGTGNLTFRVIKGNATHADDNRAAYSDSVKIIPRWSSGASPIKTGTYAIKFTATDAAGNSGPELTRTNVYVDVTDITLTDLFPTKLAYGPVADVRTDTLEEETSKLNFKLSEPADSVIIVYTKLSGADNKPERTRRLAGSELTSTALQTFPVDSLANNTTYALTVLARDLAGNYTRSGPDTFLYDTAFVVPLIQRFTIASTASGILAASHQNAGTEITLTLTADASPDGKRDAVTYKGAAILKIDARNSGGVLTSVTGDGVTDLGKGRIQLDSKTWLAGKRTVTLKDSSAIDTLAVSIVDSTDVTKPYVGKLDSLIVYVPNAYSQLVVSAPDTITQGQEFTVNVTIGDKYKNRRAGDARYVSIAANKLGIEVPEGDVYIEKGMGSFVAKATGWSGTGLVFRITDLLDANMGSTVRAGVSNAIVGMPGEGDPGPVTGPLDAPDDLKAEDFMGADGLGDQGGFVLLTWDLSDDHGSLTAYRIYREMMVNYRAGGEGEAALVMLDEPELAWVPWGKIDAVPGEDVGRAVVATLDNVATHWAIAAERGRQTTAKEAFDGVEAVATPYELMAETMVESKKAAAQVDGPVFATLTPEALAFVETGVVLRMKSVDVIMSAKTPTVEAVRAIDNIAPEPVPYLRAMDTPNDMGSSITVLWTKSESDRMLPRSYSNAIGIELADQVAGVEGYNIYRKVGNGQSSLVGKASAGETSFQDLTALNGVRYTYQVKPYDADNETGTMFERSGISIRNNAVDVSGQPIYGLFGIDTKVGFDDFFVFADNFGLSAADEIFEPAFDLIANAKIDFDDFFAFADNFGREAVAAGKVVPMMAGLNADARLYLDAGADLPKIGEEVAIDVSLADFVELKGYGFSVDYDANLLEFVKVVTDNSLLGESELAQPTVISQTDGQVAIAAYGETVSEGDLGMSLVFRTKTEIENTYVEVMESEVRDGSYAVDPVALPAPVQIQTRPEQYALGNNYPNPFNPATTIKYALPEAGFAKLEVYNVVGQVVRTLVAGQQNAGRYVVQWDASDDSGRSLSSGIYFYRLQAGKEFLEVKKMLLLK